MNIKTVYLVLCFLGALLPLSQLMPWLLEHGLNIPLFLQELFSTRVGAFFGLDVIVSAVVLFVFMLSERERLGVPYLWLPFLATLSVGVSLGLPLYLAMRQFRIDEYQANAA